MLGKVHSMHIAMLASLAAVFVLAPAASGAGSIVTGVGAGGAPQVGVFDGTTSSLVYSFFAYSTSFTGGVRVAAGDVTGDGVPDIVTGAGPGGAPHVKVFDGVTGVELRSFFAFDVVFTGGVYVAAGDVNGDGKADIFVGADSGGDPHVKVFDAVTGAELRSFFAYIPTFTGGVRVAAGDVNGDGVADIITGAGPRGGPHIKVFDGVTGAEIRSFFAFAPGFAGGVFVASGDVNGDGQADIIVSADSGGTPQVKVFDGATGVEIRSFLAYDVSFAGGVRVAAGDVTGDAVPDIVTAAGPGGGPHVNVFDGVTSALVRSFFATSPLFAGGLYVAAAPAFNPSDTTPPVLSLPTSVTVDATGPDGAVVTFAASATDRVDGDVPVTCIPASGSTFAIGDTTVRCSATDAAHNAASGAFVVHVRGAAEQLDSLHALVTSFELDPKLTAQLQKKLTEVDRALAKGADACTSLDRVLLTAIARAGSAEDELPFTDAEELLDATNQLGAVLGCSEPGSSSATVEHDLIELLRTIEALGLPGGETKALEDLTREAAGAAVTGSPCAALSDLAAKIAADTGKPNKLTAAQGAVLTAAVAAIEFGAGCP